MTGNRNIKTGLRAVIAIAVLAAAFVLPAQAFASSCSDASSDPTASQYCAVSGVQEGGNGPARDVRAANTADVTPSGTEAVKATAAGSLPFTGLDVGVLVLVAAVLTGTGLALWKVTATGDERD